MITLTDVTKIYQAKSGQITAVDNVNLTVNQGEIYGIIGYSGAGKSSLIRLLNGLETPTTGTVEVAGNDIGKIKGGKLRKARQEISMVFQHFNILWSRTVRENIAFPLEIAGISKEKRMKRVDELIKLVGLEGRENAYPSQLSGGQKQRVGIARALANNPKVLLCDEATSALDPQTTDSILDLLVDINEKLGLTIVLITHEMHVIRKICHRVAVMENGAVVEEGQVLEVFRKPKQPITKRFVQQISEPEETFETIEQVQGLYPSGQIIQLTFVGGKAEQPLITTIIKQIDVKNNILKGKMSHKETGSYGKLIVQVDGEVKEVEKVIEYNNEEEVEVEVMTND
ncbi:methionine ABC transporter ATP-binding protein [Bacillus megaterium]|nr:methionine ABC transporter ATP-binding protein [Priestia megaterium]